MTFDDVYVDLTEILSEIGAAPDVPIENEEFFDKKINEFHGSKDDFLKHTKSNMKNWFKSINKAPEWLQEPEWQFNNGRPMAFVGQHNVPYTGNYFSDDAAFYTFWDPETGETKTVVQVA